MEQPTKTHTTTNSRKHQLLLEKYALLTESAPELRAKHDEFYAYYLPGTPGECELLDMAIMASVQRGRTLECLSAIVNGQIGSAVFDFDCDQEDEVSRYRSLLETDSGTAVVGLKRSALGVRFLLQRWQRLARLLDEERTWYGNDRKEAINYQGARATVPEDLFESEGAYLTYLYCLMSQPAPKDADFIAMGNERWMPTALNDRKAEHWLGERPLCRQLLRELTERELAHLREREEQLRTQFETPARNGAEIRKQVLAGPLGAQLVRQAETHERQYLRAYHAFLKGRERTTKTGLLPGAPLPGVHGAGPDSAVSEPVEEVPSADESREKRKQVADALAPGEANGIGPPIVRGDIEREAVMATGPLSPDELRARDIALAAEAAAVEGLNYVI